MESNNSENNFLNIIKKYNNYESGKTKNKDLKKQIFNLEKENLKLEKKISDLKKKISDIKKENTDLRKEFLNLKKMINSSNTQ